MSRGLSTQQKRVLATLQTKIMPNSDKTYFSTQEIVCELFPQYTLWLMEAKQNPFVHTLKDHIDYQKNDKLRVSVYRALRSLEKRGIIMSFTLCRGGRHWAIPERLTGIDKKRLWRQEDYNARSHYWRWGAFVKTLPRELRLAYKLRDPTAEQIREIQRLWKDWKRLGKSERKSLA